MKTINEIKDELVIYYNAEGKLPLRKNFSNYQRIIKRNYGSWNSLLIELFGKVNTQFNKDKQEVVDELLEFYNKEKRIPKSSENSRLTCRVQSAFGTWNNGLDAVFGKVNQHRYKEDVIDSIKDFIIKYKRIPSREEFNGKEFPFFGAILKKLGLKRWSDIFKEIDLTGITYYADSKHGTGKIYIEEGIVYLSRQEYLIGMWLNKNKIEFEKEFPYGNCNYVFDFYLPEKDVYIEYYGLSHIKEYKDRIEEKRSYYNGRIVIEIMKHDNTIEKLSQEVQRL